MLFGTTGLSDPRKSSASKKQSRMHSIGLNSWSTQSKMVHRTLGWIESTIWNAVPLWRFELFPVDLPIFDESSRSLGYNCERKWYSNRCCVRLHAYFQRVQTRSQWAWWSSSGSCQLKSSLSGLTRSCHRPRSKACCCFPWWMWSCDCHAFSRGRVCPHEWDKSRDL